MWHDLLVAFSLVLVIEGIVPFLSPRGWRRLAYQVAQLEDRHLRIAGLVMMLLGLGLLSVLK